MTFQISIGFSGLDNPDGKDEQSKNYALFIGDTVVVNEVNKFLLIFFF
jgi:nucleosome binding factor SPN SPT16 subunit